MNSLEIKNQGNTCFTAKDYQASLNLYLLSLSTEDKHLDLKLKMILHSNISQSYNLLEKPDESLEHIEKAIEMCHELKLEGRYLEKFQYRKAKAMVIKGRYGEARQGLDPKSKDQGVIDIIKIIEMKEQQQKGFYNLAKIDEETDINEFFGPISIQPTSDDRGNGLFATRDIKQGELIICERSFADSFRSDLSEEQQIL